MSTRPGPLSLVWVGFILLFIGGCVQTPLDRPPPAPAPVPAVEAAIPTQIPPPAPERTPEKIVYNADVAPQLPRDRAAPDRPVLEIGKAVTLRFDIGPKWETSIVPDAIPDSQILQSEDIPLTVVLACNFCEPYAESMKRMTFRGGKGRSDEVSFQFTPKPGQDGSGYTEALQLAILNDKTGREYDRLVVPVLVRGVNDVPPDSVGSTSATVSFAQSDIADGSDWQSDVTLYANEEAGRYITISVEPVSAEMKRLLGPLALDSNRARRIFRSGINDAELLSLMTNSAYGAMSAVSLQGEFLERLSATGVNAAVSPENQESLELSDAEAANIAGVIATTGQRLYRRLFHDSADVPLRQLIRALEAAAAAAPPSKPLRMKIVTNRLSLPWQYLHPVGPSVNAKKFWGMQFSLSVHRANDGSRHRRELAKVQPVRKVMFARYGSSGDPSARFAEEQAAQLLSLPMARNDLILVDTGPDLLEGLRTQRNQVAGIVTFLHASAGLEGTVPHLKFNDEDMVSSDNLEDLLNKVEEDEQDLRYLAGAPLVFLNACETGPARNLPHVKLENAMFQLGARGVVVTEVSVWIRLGHEMATRLIARLGQGEPVSDALTAVRRELLAEKKNPLGLLYAYYGDPAATLRP